MATLTKVQRARILMDVLQDGNVPSLAAYADVELIDGPTALKYAQAFWDAYDAPLLTDENGEPRLPTNEELATFYLNSLKQHHRAVLGSGRVKAAVETARSTTVDAVTQESIVDLSGLEPIT